MGDSSPSSISPARAQAAVDKLPWHQLEDRCTTWNATADLMCPNARACLVLSASTAAQGRDHAVAAGTDAGAVAGALPVDEILPQQPLRQSALSVPYPLRFLFASRPDVMGRVLAIVHRAIATQLIRKAGFTRRSACKGRSHASAAYWQRAEPQHAPGHPQCLHTVKTRSD